MYLGVFIQDTANSYWAFGHQHPRRKLKHRIDSEPEPSVVPVDWQFDLAFTFRLEPAISHFCLGRSWFRTPLSVGESYTKLKQTLLYPQTPLQDQTTSHPVEFREGRITCHKCKASRLRSMNSILALEHQQMVLVLHSSLWVRAVSLRIRSSLDSRFIPWVMHVLGPQISS